LLKAPENIELYPSAHRIVGFCLAFDSPGKLSWHAPLTAHGPIFGAAVLFNFLSF
jgi:hypothetical protein